MLIPIVAVGTIRLSPDFILHNVLYIPHFNTDCMCVSTLLTYNHFSYTFFNHFLIQEMGHSKKIINGNLTKGLYTLSSRDLTSTKNASLWNMFY